MSEQRTHRKNQNQADSERGTIAHAATFTAPAARPTDCDQAETMSNRGPALRQRFWGTWPPGPQKEPARKPQGHYTGVTDRLRG